MSACHDHPTSHADCCPMAAPGSLTISVGALPVATFTWDASRGQWVETTDCPEMANRVMLRRIDELAESLALIKRYE